VATNVRSDNFVTRSKRSARSEVGPMRSVRTAAVQSRQERLRIAQVAPLWMRVPPPEYGGAELMVHWLTEELVRSGHDVTLFASGDSVTSAALHATCDRGVVEKMRSSTANTYPGYAVSALAQALQRADEFDVVHSHIGPLGLALGGVTDTPVVHTVHEGLDSVDEHWLLAKHPDATVAAISDSQVASVEECRRRSITTVYHGMDFTGYDASATHDGYVLFLGRMAPHKNPAGALRVARAAGFPVVIAGRPQSGSERAYFDEEIAPWLDDESARYVGAVSHDEKIRLLQRAAALVFPIQWDEHFGLVMIEAMACGTPVAAFERGSVPEVIDRGVTGEYATSEEELAALLPIVVDLDRTTVARRARERVGVERMAAEYVAAYRAVIRERRRSS
jgi:glycosyltransferase involved in cell wall biosynthesis